MWGSGLIPILPFPYCHSHTGLNDIVPDHLLHIFDENELEVQYLYMYTCTIVLSLSAPDVWYWHSQLWGPEEACSGECQQQSCLPKSGLLVLGSGQQLYSGRNGKTTAICDWLFSASSWRIQGAQSQVSDHISTHAWPPALSTHLVRSWEHSYNFNFPSLHLQFQPVMSTRIWLVWTVSTCTYDGFKWRSRGIWPLVISFYNMM